MSEPIILDWDRIVHKNVRAKDMEDVGNIIAVDNDSITLMQGRHEYKIPKSSIEGYNGSEVFLTLTTREVYNFEVKT